MIANFKDINSTGGGTSKPVVVESLNVTANGSYTPKSGVDCFNPVNVNVPTTTKGFDVSQLRPTFIVDTGLDTFDKTGLDLSKCTGFYCRNTALKSLDIGGLDTRNLTYFALKDQYNALALTDLDISGLDLSGVTELYLYRLNSLVNIYSDGLKLPDVDMSENAYFGDSSPLTVDSIVGLLNALPQSTNGNSFRIGTVNINKLSDEQKAIATNKNWRLI